MKNIKIIIGIIVAVVIVGLIVSYSSNKKSVSEKQTIKIGVIAPVTGPASAFGQPLVKALELALKDVPKDSKYNYEIVIEDDATNPAKSASAAQKLIQIDKVQAIISATSGTGNAIMPIITTAKIPQICVACADRKIAVGAYSYTSSIQPEDEGKVYIDYAVKTGVKTLGMLNQIHPGINAVADGIKGAALKQGVQIVYEERFDGNNRDFKTIAAKAAAAKADVYYIQALPPSLDILGKELYGLGVKNLAAGSGAFTISANPAFYEGNWYSESLSDASFTDRFQKAYPDVRFNVRTAPYGYDAFMMLVKGFEKGGDMGTYLSGLTEYKGLVGRQYKNSGTNYFASLPGIYKIQDGKPTLVWKE